MKTEYDKNINDGDLPQQRMITLLYRTARELWSSAFNGGLDGHKRFEKMHNIEIGDLVIEVSSLTMRNASAEKTCTAIGWLKAVNGDKYTIERLDTGEIFTWSNAEFVKIPIAV